MHKLILRYQDWTFDFVECSEADYPALTALTAQAEDFSIIHMPDDSHHPWNEAYLPQPWREEVE